MKKTYTSAVIGVGAANKSNIKGGGHRIGYTHANMYRRNPRITLSAGADINPANLQAFREAFQLTSGFEDYKQMLRTLKPDIVSICTYLGLHRSMIEAAAGAGVKGIICEKPFLASPADLRAVQELAQETGVKIVVPHIRRYRPAFIRARELYNNGSVGSQIMCMAGLENWDLSEWGSHWLDMFRFFHNDQPVRYVMGQTRVRNLRGYGHAMEDHAIAYFEFENGARGLVDGGRKLPGETMTLVGTQGTIQVIREHELRIQTSEGIRQESFVDDPQSAFDACFDQLLADLITWLDGGPEPMLGLTNVAKSSELNLGAYLSSLRRDRIDLPLQDECSEWPLEALAAEHKQEPALA
jgi:predicted dehydrogenase